MAAEPTLESISTVGSIAPVVQPPVRVFRRGANGRLNMDWTGEVPFETIAQIAMRSGRAAGAVSSVQVSHATPASVIAHNVSRNNYTDIFTACLASARPP